LQKGLYKRRIETMSMKKFLSVTAILILLCLACSIFVKSGGAAVPMRAWMSMVFAEDPLRMHGLQAKSYFTQIGMGQTIVLDEVSSEQKYVLTDIYVADHSTGKLSVMSQNETKFKMSTTIVYDHNLSQSFRTGLVFEPGDEIKIQLTGNTVYVTVSGYFVDL